jgi:Arylsulfotransferase (ASST)
MKKVALLVNLIVLFANGLRAQIVPVEGAVLNYRIVGFSVPFAAGASGFDLEIARGTIDKEEQFKKNIVMTVTCAGSRTIAEVPDFGARYTWRVVYRNKVAGRHTSELHHFSTGIIPDIDTNNLRLRVTNSGASCKDGYVMLDGSRVMYDMQGHPVWYMPEIGGVAVYPNDIRPSGKGGITFVNGNGYDIGYDGAILWQTPGTIGVTDGHCHHEFTRLENGHYMALRMEDDNTTHLLPTADVNEAKARETRHKLMFSKLVEYDTYGNVVWEWKTSDYSKSSDLEAYIARMSNDIKPTDLHENAFYFDEKHKVVYLNYKNISRIIKIQYPEGKVIATYGEKYEGGPGVKVSSLFCGEHCVKPTSDGCILIFNNNACNNGYPIIEKLREPATGTGMPEIVWQYTCSRDMTVTAEGFASGGNVTELTDGSVFVAAASPDSRLFIVNMAKEVLWSAVPEKRNGDQWVPATHYRASIIPGKKELEDIIWRSATERTPDAAAASQDAIPEPLEERTHVSGTQ